MAAKGSSKLKSRKSDHSKRGAAVVAAEGPSGTTEVISGIVGEGWGGEVEGGVELLIIGLRGRVKNG